MRDEWDEWNLMMRMSCWRGDYPDARRCGGRTKAVYRKERGVWLYDLAVLFFALCWCFGEGCDDCLGSGLV